MSALREAAQQALEALEFLADEWGFTHKANRPERWRAIEALRAALAQQAEPVQDQRCRAEPRSDGDFVCDCKIGECPGRSAVVEQVLEACEQRFQLAEQAAIIDELNNLRAALAQQAEPQGCATEEDCTKQPWCRIRGECQRKQAEPVEPRRWKGDNNIESPFNACMHKTYCMTLKQAEPLNLADPAVQKRLATQWGYVPAAQAEPDLSRCPQCNGPADNGHDRSIPPNPYLCTKCMSEPAEPVAQQAKPVAGVVLNEEGRAALVEHGREEWHCVSRNARRLYTAPPQRKLVPLTAQELDGVIERHVGGSEITDDMYTSMEQFARAVEKAVWEKNHG